MNNDRLKNLGLEPFDPTKIGLVDVYDTAVHPTPEKVREAVVLKDGSIVCQWENGTVGYASQNRLAMSGGYSMNEEKTQIAEMLAPALRQYQHNDGSGFLCGYDYSETQKVVSELYLHLEGLRKTILQEAEYCYGWADHFHDLKDYDRAKRHRERGDRLMRKTRYGYEWHNTVTRA